LTGIQALLLAAVALLGLVYGGLAMWLRLEDRLDRLELLTFPEPTKGTRGGMG